MWTFQTLSNFRINITFQKFYFHKIDEHLDFGDGLSGEQATQLGRFSGSILPSDLISVSSVMWAYIENRRGNISCRLEMTISSIEDIGKSSYLPTNTNTFLVVHSYTGQI